MIKVLLSRNYEYPDIKRQTPENSGIWNNIEITEDEGEEVDFIVVFNSPAKDIQVRANEGGRWLFVQEPPYERYDFLKYHFRFTDKVISGFSSQDGNESAQAGLPWHIDKSFDELVNLRPEFLSKENKLSWITSNKNLFKGHQIRLDFIDFLNQQGLSYDLLGRGFKEIDNKFDGLASYKYSIAVENYISNDYWTEKLIDCILSWTIPIYCGCQNLSDYLPSGSFIQIDISQKEDALAVINKTLKSNYWEENLEALSQAREMILNEYQFFPMIEKRINEYYKNNPNPSKKNYYIPKSGLTKTEEIKRKIKSVFKRTR